MSLYDFEEIGPPELHKKGNINHFRRGPVGYLARSEERGLCYVSRRNREDHGDDDKHFFEKLQGYAVSESILKKLSKQERLLDQGKVETIIIVEKDRENVYEFGIAQFNNGHPIEYDDPQKVVPVDEAKRSWDLNETTLYT